MCLRRRTARLPDPRGVRYALAVLLDTLLVALEVVDSIAPEMVPDPQKNALKPWRKQYWCIPPQVSAACVHNRQDVLEVYRRPPDDRFPVVCVDETSKQPVSATRGPPPPAPGPLRLRVPVPGSVQLAPAGRTPAGLVPSPGHGAAH